MPRMPKISDRPTPISAYIAPRTRPWKISSERTAGSSQYVEIDHQSHSRMMSVEPLLEVGSGPVVAVRPEIEHVDVVGDLDRFS